MTKPNFFIIGAPKCGTTALAHWLSQHPEVFLSPVKEPHFYNTDMRNRFIRSRSDYEALFQGASASQHRLGEASIWYLYSREAVPNILSETPDARFIVALRNPADMAVSLHNQHLNSLYEDIPRFEDAWKAQADRAEGRQVNAYCDDPEILMYGPACRLGTQLDALLRNAPQASVKVVFLEDLRQEPRTTYLEILEFLELSDDARRDFPVVNQASALRSVAFRKLLWQVGQMKARLGFPMLNTGVMHQLLSLNRKRRGETSIDPAFMQREVYPYFDPEIDLVEKLTGRSLSHWRA